MSVIEAPPSGVEREVERLQTAIEQLREELRGKEALIERLSNRVLSKDAEFQQERQTWRRKENEYRKTIGALRRGPSSVPTRRH